MEERLETVKMDSFQIEQEITIQAPRERVFQALTAEIGDWWSFRIGEDKDTKLRFEPKVGGRFYEDFDNEQGALWGIVNYIKAPVEIRLIGALGMGGAVTGSYKYKLEEQDGSTVIKLSHHAVGLLRPEWKDSYSHGWKVLLGDCLREHIENSIRA